MPPPRLRLARRSEKEVRIEELGGKHHLNTADVPGKLVQGFCGLEAVKGAGRKHGSITADKPVPDDCSPICAPQDRPSAEKRRKYRVWRGMGIRTGRRETWNLAAPESEERGARGRWQVDRDK